MRRVVRHPLVYWAGAVLVATTTAAVVHALVARADAALHQWGDTRPAVVALVSLDRGHVVAPGDVAVREMPVALLPAGAVAAPPLGQVIAAPVYAGEVVVSGRLAAGSARGVAALLPPGTRGIAVPVGPASVDVLPGDAVDVLATFDPSMPDPTFSVAEGALVVAVDEQQVTVAVTVEEAPRVAFALAQAQVTLALTGTG
jgi:Flp pilus assembly protein CpaB